MQQCSHEYKSKPTCERFSTTGLNLGPSFNNVPKRKFVLTDRFILEEEEENNTFVVDAKWFGSVGRFLNHSCQPNLDKVIVYCETQDIRMPRLAFFASEFIPAKTELCYDYGYHAGYVEGKSRQCLCGAEQCRKNWY
eukprot:gene29846-39601_t